MLHVSEEYGEKSSKNQNDKASERSKKYGEKCSPKNKIKNTLQNDAEE